ncbi:MAG: IclR family transcriptional regulator [Acidobacteriaceae bacterium]|jgi:DNA-binding IclR family transcriptional regulator
MTTETIKAPPAGAKKAVRRRIPKWALQSDASPTGQQYYLRTIGRALEVLDCFDGQVPLSLKEITTRVDLPETTLFRVLLTLEKHKYLQQHRDGTYQLAPKLIFGWLVQAADHVRSIARPELERLSSTFDETVSLSYLYDDRIHVLDCIETFHEIRMTNKIGRVLPPHCSAMGKVITAFQERALADRILEVYGLYARTEFTIVDRHKLFKDFEEIRRTGISSDREESIRGGICFGAALRTEDRPVVAAISISTPTTRMTSELEQDIKAAILVAAERIADLLKNAGPVRAST